VVLWAGISSLSFGMLYRYKFFYKHFLDIWTEFAVLWYMHFWVFFCMLITVFVFDWACKFWCNCWKKWHKIMGVEKTPLKKNNHNHHDKNGMDINFWRPSWGCFLTVCFGFWYWISCTIRILFLSGHKIWYWIIRVLWCCFKFV